MTRLLPCLSLLLLAAGSGATGPIIDSKGVNMALYQRGRSYRVLN